MPNKLSRTLYYDFYYSGLVSMDFKHENNNEGKDTGIVRKYAGMNHYEYRKMFILVTMKFL